MNDEKLKKLLGEPISNLCQSEVDKFIEENVKQRHKLGMGAVIIRHMVSNCCDWCKNLAGLYEYGKEPKDVYRRHDNCNCLVTFKSSKGGYKDVYRKQEFDNYRDARINSNISSSNSRKVIDVNDAMEYNISPIEELKKNYKQSVDSGMLSPLVGEDIYISYFRRIEREILGKTSHGIKIKSISNHFMERFFGTMVDPKKLRRELKIVRRSGVEFEDVYDALFGKNSIIRKSEINNSIMFIGKKCNVAVNPETGKLIQCNPRR